MEIITSVKLKVDIQYIQYMIIRIKKNKLNYLHIYNNIETFSILGEEISKLEKSMKREEHLTNDIKNNFLHLNLFFLEYQDHIGSKDKSYLIPLIIYIKRAIAKDLKQYRNI